MSKVNYILLAVFTGGLLVSKINQPFWGHHEFNGVFYGTIAKNYRRYGLGETRGAQITNAGAVEKADWSFHTNHPATYPLLLAFFYKLWGGGEAVSRVVSIAASAAAVLILTRFLVRLFGSGASWIAVLPLIATPLFRYYGSLPVFEPLLFPLVVLGIERYYFSRNNRDFRKLALVCFLAAILDWPGLWLPILIAAAELMTKKRVELIKYVLGGTALALGLILAHQLVAYGNLDGLLAVFARRVAAASQPYTAWSWLRLLVSRTRAFFGLPLVSVAAAATILLVKPGYRKLIPLFILALLTGASHIFVFRNITWYHDYMLYHLLPFVGLSLGVVFDYLKKKTKDWRTAGIIMLAIAGLNLVTTGKFYQALVELKPHQDCVEMGRSVRESGERLEFRLNREKAQECPPFIGYYGEKDFQIVIAEN